MKMPKKQNLKQLFVIITGLLLANIIGNFFFYRFDLTKDQRYTLSKTSLTIIKEVKEPLIIDVFLKGNYPGEFKKLQTETQQLLEEFKAYNRNITFQFVNPIEDDAERDIIMQSFIQRGLTPLNVTVEDKGKQTQEIVFPWAIATYNGKSTNVPLLKNLMGASTAEKVNSSVQHLEYAIANAINTVVKEKEKKVAVIKGNGEMEDLLMADFIKQVRQNYYIGTFTLDSVAKKPTESLAYLNKYDLAIIAKPSEKFSEVEKQVLDQYIINGGKTLWLLDQVSIEMDSLYNDNGASLAYPKDLGLTDMFFKYGFRIRPDLIKDEQATPIKLVTGQQGSASQYTQYFWKYAPLIYPNLEHPIVTNIDGIRFDFANPIEILQNQINKTVLLKSSKFSKPVGSPVEINLNSVSEQTKPEEYLNQGEMPVALLLEGKFNSMYTNRVLPFDDETFKTNSKNSKMIVISDADVVKNQLDKNRQPLELGYDKWTSALYGNKDFLMNCVNYLLDDNGLINIRSKEVNLPLLDKDKVIEKYTQSQIITVGLPILILGFFGLVFTYLRKRKYAN